MDRDRACMGNKISERFLKDLAYGRMWEDDGLQLGGLHAFFDSDPGYDDQLGGRISQEVGADDRFVFSQNQLADALPCSFSAAKRPKNAIGIFLTV